MVLQVIQGKAHRHTSHASPNATSPSRDGKWTVPLHVFAVLPPSDVLTRLSTHFTPSLPTHLTTTLPIPIAHHAFLHPTPVSQAFQNLRH